MDIWKPNMIMCGPGGAKSFLLLGALKKFFEEEFLENVEIWAGVSAGAAISLLLVCGYSIEEIIDICLNLDILEDLVNINISEIPKKMGLIPNHTVEEKLKDGILKKFGYIPTLKQLYDHTKYHLTLVSFNLDKMKAEFLDKDTEPNLSCLEAAMMSMAIPILVQPRKYKGNIYVDGALGAPYPVLHFDHNQNKILGMYISSEQDLYTSDNKTVNFFYRLIQASMKALRDNEISLASDNVKHLKLQTDVRDITGISLILEMRQKMIQEGEEYAKAFLKVNNNPDKYNLDLPEGEEIPFSFEN